MKASHRKDVIIARLNFCSNMSFSYCPDCYNSDYRYLKGRQKKRSRTRYNRMQLAKVKLTVPAIVIQR